MRQGGGLQGLGRTLSHAATSDANQFVINQRRQLPQRTGVPVRPGLKQLRDVRGCGQNHR